MKFYKYLISFIIITSSSLSLATERINLKIIPIKSMSYHNSDLVINFDLPCGTDISGLIVVPRGDRELDIAVLGVANRLFCAGMPRYVTQTVGFIDPTKVRKINYISPDIDKVKNKLSITPIKDIRVLSTGYTNKYVVQTVVDSTCRDNLGYVIQQDAISNSLLFASLDLVSTQRNSQGRCVKTGQSPKLLDFVRVPQNKTLKTEALAIKPQSPEKLYDLKIKQIQKGSVSKTVKGGVKASYIRKCNEAPVGVIMTPGSKNVRLGVVVAHYFNKSCQPGEKKSYLDTISSDELNLPANKSVSLMASSKGFAKFTMKSPNSFKSAKKDNQIGLKVTYINGCSAPVGIVYGPSGTSGSTLGILEEASKSGQCVQVAKPKNIFVPYFATTQKRQLAPLRLRGSMYF